MPSDFCAFNGLVRANLVRHGVDERLPEGLNMAPVVYREMLTQICRDYASLPDPRTLKLSEIRFFYDGMRAELKRHTEPK